MMIALSSIDELHAAKNKIEQLNDSRPALFDTLLHVVSLTKQMQLRYEYLGCLVMGENPTKHVNRHIRMSLLKLYQQEVQSLQHHPETEEVIRLFSTYKDIGYQNICKLVLGESPESLKGVPERRF
ncbi:hypothetical protein D7Z54_09435 [Salibacterium salarium]|uniref:Uncharacterized protein n=1 Tax=Salibacterium salarium TaxID=284579 RepID=A0A428N5L6_9BACI|nr:hypothetical protein [Salibacterium salarium]RSL33532.1 hypothetical protein D7Z54_09435 [Salibacterium salarium]